MKFLNFYCWIINKWYIFYFSLWLVYGPYNWKMQYVWLWITNSNWLHLDEKSKTRYDFFFSKFTTCFNPLCLKQKCDDNDTNVLWFIYLFLTVLKELFIMWTKWQVVLLYLIDYVYQLVIIQVFFQLTSCQTGSYSTNRKSASICFLLLRLPSCLFTHYHFEKKWSNQSLWSHLGCPGPVSCMKWTPDGTALAMAWERGGFSIWSTFGAMIMCSLCWDYGKNDFMNFFSTKKQIIFFVNIRSIGFWSCGPKSTLHKKYGLVSWRIPNVDCQFQN